MARNPDGRIMNNKKNGLEDTSDIRLKRILNDTKTIAVVGASADPARPSWQVMKFLQSVGYRTIPVNPELAGRALHGERVYSSLSDIPEPFDMVDIFRRSDAVAAIIDETLSLASDHGTRTIWMQLGVHDDAAAARAMAAGIDVVKDHCPKVEYARLFSSARS